MSSEGEGRGLTRLTYVRMDGRRTKNKLQTVFGLRVRAWTKIPGTGNANWERGGTNRGESDSIVYDEEEDDEKIHAVMF